MKLSYLKDISIIHGFNVYFLNGNVTISLPLLTACSKPLMFSTSSAEPLFLIHMLHVVKWPQADKTFSPVTVTELSWCSVAKTHHRSCVFISCSSLRSRKSVRFLAYLMFQTTSLLMHISMKIGRLVLHVKDGLSWTHMYATIHSECDCRTSFWP